MRSENEQSVADSFSAEELTAAFYTAWEEGRPASVVKVNKKQKERYRELKMPSLQLDCEAGRQPVSLDDIHVNVSLLSANKLDALSGSLIEHEPFAVESLKKKESSVINMEDMFLKGGKGDEEGLQMAAGIAGSGKSTAFMYKAPFEWSKEARDRAFWENFSLFFLGSLNDKSWWKAEDLVMVFGLYRYSLTETEKDEVVSYICDHSDEVLLVADSLDEAAVDKRSLLWRVLCGQCLDVPKLHVIICSRPCENALWMSKHCLFHRRLEVVGFTEEKIGRFIRAFFHQDPEKACQLEGLLSARLDVHSLMHTPLLATMICCLFQLKKELPSTQTDVYQSAVLSMLQLSAERDMEEMPCSILDDLPPSHLQVAVQNLCKLAFDGLAKKQVVFRKSVLHTSGCLGAAVDLGFLSSAVGVGVAGQGEDSFSFQHHTMLEFFAAVHAVHHLLRKSKKKIGKLVEEISMDGDFAKFWLFISGLLTGDECELLLKAFSKTVEDISISFRAKRSQRLLLLLHCHNECADKLPREGSPSFKRLIGSLGLRLGNTHLTEGDAHIVGEALRRYSSVTRCVDLTGSSMEDRAASELIAGLQECSQLTELALDALSRTTVPVSGIADVVERNQKSLTSLVIPTSDTDLQSVAPAVKKCSNLNKLMVGSQALSNASAPAIADILRHQRGRHMLSIVGLFAEMDDEGFSLIAPPLQEMAGFLKMLTLQWLRVSPALLFTTLSALPRLTSLFLVGCRLGDSGLPQLVNSLQGKSKLESLHLYDVGLTWRSGSP